LANGFQRRRSKKISQLETRIAYGGHVCYRIETKWPIFIEDMLLMIPTKFWFISPSGARGEDFKKSANQKQELPMVAMFVNGSGQN
jgi:hypothetical protein